MSGRESLLRAAARGADRLALLAEGLAVVLLALIFLILIAEVLSRNILGHSLAGSWEIASFLMAAMFFLGLAPALRAGSHVRVTMLSHNLRGMPRRIAEAAVHLIALLVSNYAAMALFQLASTSLTRGTKSWELALPLAVPQFAIAIGMTILSIGFAARLVLIVLDGPLPEPERE